MSNVLRGSNSSKTKEDFFVVGVGVFKYLSTHSGCLLIMTRPSMGCLLAFITMSVSLCLSSVGISVTVASNVTLVVQDTDIIVSFSHLILAAGSVFISQSTVYIYTYV